MATGAVEQETAAEPKNELSTTWGSLECPELSSESKSFYLALDELVDSLDQDALFFADMLFAVRLDADLLCSR